MAINIEKSEAICFTDKFTYRCCPYLLKKYGGISKYLDRPNQISNVHVIKRLSVS